MELWKDKVFPKILESGYDPQTTLPVYFVVSITMIILLITGFSVGF